MNHINPDLFMACFSSWVAECWPDKLDLAAIDGKTSRRSHNRKTGQEPLHLVSAFATNSRLVLGQEAVDEKSNDNLSPRANPRNCILIGETNCAPIQVRPNTR
jgi:hypothetical protein